MNSTVYLYPTQSNQSAILFTEYITTSFVSSSMFHQANYTVYIKKSSDGKTIYWYGNNASNDFNYDGGNPYTWIYYFIGIA